MSRVTVVLSQGYRLGVERQHREDELIAELLMSPQVEATIVADLARIDPASTDQLCLESIPGTAIVLAWHNAATTIAEFHRIGIHAQLLNESTDARPATVDQPSKHAEFYFYDLNEQRPTKFYLDVVARVAEEAEKAPVALTNLVNGNELRMPSPPREPVDTTPRSRTAGTNSAPPDDTEPRDALDDLMDELDRVEL